MFYSAFQVTSIELQLSNNKIIQLNNTLKQNNKKT